jgi:hypothetical protein
MSIVLSPCEIQNNKLAHDVRADDLRKRLVNANLIDYSVPRFSDVAGECETVLVENQDGLGPHGARGMDEGGLVAAAPAITSSPAAMEFAARIFTPEPVWCALNDRRIFSICLRNTGPP